MNEGYTLSDFAQITEEPTIATCNLNKDKKTVAILYFYGIKEKISREQLPNIPVDMVFLPKNKRYNDKRKRKKKNRTLFSKMLWTFLLHLITAALFASIFAFSALFSFFSHTMVDSDGSAIPLGVALLVLLPVMFTVILWGGGVVGEKGAALKKILLSLGVILNVCITLLYVYFIAAAFTGA